MSIITILWSFASAACLTLALQHLLIWFKNKKLDANLFLTMAAAGAAGNALLELYALKADSIDEIIFAFSYAHIMVFLIIVSLTWFIFVYFKSANKVLAVIITLLWSLVIIINAFSEFSVVYTNISGINYSETYWGESYALAAGEVNLWKYLADLASLVFVIYTLTASVSEWKSGVKRRAAVMGGSILFFILLGGIYTPLVDEGLIETPSIISFAFLGIVFAMSYEMGREVAKNAELSKEVKQGELRWKRLLNAMKFIVLEFDRKGSIVYCNPFFSKLTSIDSEKLIGKSYKELFPESEMDQICQFTENVNMTEDVPSFQCRIKTANDDTRIIDWQSVALLDKEGNWIRSLSLGIDVTEKEEAFESIKNLKEQLVEENLILREDAGFSFGQTEILGQSDAIKYNLTRVEQVGPTDTTVLIEGESGVGKDLFARAIHEASERSNRAFVVLNCAAMPSSLLESELFGHEKGAFTGADRQRKGRFEIADNGTLFLDEIGELPLELQGKLLRVIEEGEFERLGSNTTIKVDVRIITATNRILKDEIDKGNFREDLYYRLSAYPISVSPLRKRKDDIPIFIEHFVQMYSRKLGKKIEKVSKATQIKLQEYDWPGNVRELRNIVERAVIASSGNKLVIVDELKSESVYENDSNNFKPLDEFEKDYIIKVLKKTNWKITGNGGASEILKVHPNTLRSRMQKLGISKPE